VSDGNAVNYSQQHYYAVTSRHHRCRQGLSSRPILVGVVEEERTDAFPGSTPIMREHFHRNASVPSACLRAS
jgi:hypothetical protein